MKCSIAEPDASTMIVVINVWLDVRKVTDDSCCEVACEHYYSPSDDVLWRGGSLRCMLKKKKKLRIRHGHHG
jgi:hypothetical protein